MTQDNAHSKQDQKTAGILAAARAQFATLGFEATKLADVATKADVAVGTIYLRYKGKSELLAGVLHAVEASFCAAIDTPIIWEKPFPDRFSLIMHAVINHAMNEKDLGILMALTPYAAPAANETGSTIREMISKQLADGVQREELRSDLNIGLAARLAHGMVEGAIIELMTNPDCEPIDVADELALASSRWLT